MATASSARPCSRSAASPATTAWRTSAIAPWPTSSLRRPGSYAKPVKTVLRHYRVKQVVHGIAHITGGGLADNLARIVPNTVQVMIDRGSWTMPGVFPWLQKLGDIAADEMDRVFNMGLGMVLVVSPHFADSIRHQLADLGFETGRSCWSARRRRQKTAWSAVGLCHPARGWASQRPTGAELAAAAR